MKICNKCGVSIENDALFCVKCGTIQAIKEINEQSEEVDIETEKVSCIDNFNQTQTEYKINKSKKGLILGIALGVLVLVTVLSMFLFVPRLIGSDDPKEIVVEYLEAIEESDTEAMLECMACSTMYRDKLSEISENNNLTMKNITMEGNIVDKAYTIGEIKKLSDKEKKEFWKYVAWYSVMVDEKEVEDLRKCEVSYTVYKWISRNKKSVDFELYIGKYKGEWKIIGSGF